MTRRPATWQSSVERMCKAMKDSSDYSEASIRTFRFTTVSVARRLEGGGKNTLPWEISKSDVLWLKALLDEEKLTVATRTGYLSALRRWTEYYGNRVMKGLKFRTPSDMRPNVDWLSIEQARLLLAVEKSPLDAFIVHCELCLGMRRIEVLRLTSASFSGYFVDIIGKGSMGGKPRRVPYHRDTDKILRDWIAERERIIGKVRRISPSAAEPESLLIWGRKGTLSPYSLKGTGIDGHMNKMGAAIGYPSLSNHTLRRTFGRMMYRSNVPVATISKMLGHESMDMTLKYLGIDMDDMQAAMMQFTL